MCFELSLRKLQNRKPQAQIFLNEAQLLDKSPSHMSVIIIILNTEWFNLYPILLFSMVRGSKLYPTSLLSPLMMGLDRVVSLPNSIVSAERFKTKPNSVVNCFFCIFYQVNDLFLHQSYLKSPLPVKLT